MTDPGHEFNPGGVVEIDGYDSAFIIDCLTDLYVSLSPVDRGRFPFPASFRREAWDWQVQRGHIRHG